MKQDVSLRRTFLSFYFFYHQFPYKNIFNQTHHVAKTVTNFIKQISDPTMEKCFVCRRKSKL